jgi:hypothetical protein
VLITLLASSCGAPRESADSSKASAPADTAGTDSPPAPGTVTRGDASTNLDTTPLSAADYALYASIMGGASAMLSVLSPEDTAALEFAKKVDAGTARVTPATEPLIAKARALQQKDLELARLQGIDARYLAVKRKVEAVIGPNARPPAEGDAVAKENLRFLEAHRQTIERFQRILRDPLSKQPAAPPL